METKEKIMQEKSCGTVLFTLCDGVPHYLLTRARDGYCGFPKGHMEGEETEEQTAWRETGGSSLRYRSACAPVVGRLLRWRWRILES